MIMSKVSVREFSYNPSAMFARVEQGERLEVTRHGEVIAVLIPPPRTQDRYEELVALGEIRPATGNLTAGDWRQFTHFDVPDDVDPLAVLLEMREDER
ncbi:MAG TPA: type II toxin-antitoxin system prevent-host-death family antitoxin [Pseudonocardiaceae bacterium]|jgi:prevent-host-death family protein